MKETLEDLKRQIDIRDLAERLGLERPDPSGNYRSPHHTDRMPSLQVGGRKYPDGFYDYSSGQGGDCIDLVRYALGLETADAIRWLRDQYGILAPKTALEPARPATLVDHIAAQSVLDTAPASAYLRSRGLAPGVIARAIAAKSIGFNGWTSPSKPPGACGHGGPATVFLVRTFNPGTLVAVDMRYHDPALNGGQKSGSQGEKKGHPWTSYLKALQRAHTVVIVESPINALSAESAFEAKGWRGWAAVALRGLSNADAIDVRLYQGKRVILCLDNDAPDANGHRPGPEAAWTLHARLTAQRIAAHFVDQADWDCNDLNDVLQLDGPEKTAKALETLQPWAIPGLPAVVRPGKQRVRLPPAEFAMYPHFRVREDFTCWFTTQPDLNGDEVPKWEDLAGFRVVDIAKIKVASAKATMLGEQDHQPTVLLAVTSQISFAGHVLRRHVTNLDRMFNAEWWKRVGPIWKPHAFFRLIQIWGYASELNERGATNFVGLCWKEGKPYVSEGADTYFPDPEKQCPYHNLTFPTGPVSDARRIMHAYAATFANQVGVLMLTWALGGHLKAFLSFWPHGILQAQKGAGKTFFTEHLSRTIACKVFSGQSLQSDFRVVTSISHTTHPVFCEELSARDQRIIDKAVSNLQEAYKFLSTNRTSEMTEYVLCAPVLLVGESVQEPAKSLLGKTVRFELGQQGPMLGADLPTFPVRPWLDYLAALNRETVNGVYAEAIRFCQAHCRADVSDGGARRMVENYAAVLTAWRFLRDFAGVAPSELSVEAALLEGMNGFIAETRATRQPWVWILETTLLEIAADAYPFPYRFGEINGQEVFFIRCSHAMHHIRTKPGLRAIWDQLPVKGESVFKSQLKEAGVIVSDRVDPTIGGERVAHMVALSILKLAEYGLHPEIPDRER